MRGSNYSHNLQDGKQNTQLRPYPVSARAYKKKDYDYLSTFPRMEKYSEALRPSTQHDDAELSHARSDGESDAFTTASSTEYATSLSSASSTSSSIQSYAKYVVSLTNMESNNQHQSSLNQDHSNHHHHHHHHHLQSSKTSLIPPRNSTEITVLQKLNDEKVDGDLNAILEEDKSVLPGPVEKDSFQIKDAPIRPRMKVKSRHLETPAVLPKFGSWDTKNPSSGEAYTLIFRRLRDEKQSGGVPLCGSPTHPEAEEADEEPLKIESKAKEPVCSNARARRDASKRKSKSKSNQETAQYRTRWILCCKASVLDD